MFAVFAAATPRFFVSAGFVFLTAAPFVFTGSATIASLSFVAAILSERAVLAKRNGICNTL